MNIKLSGFNLRPLLKMIKATTYQTYHCFSAIFMIMALLWLSVSTPFVFENQKKKTDNAKCCSQSPFSGMEEENKSSTTNNAEEKIPKTTFNNFTEEYLHDHHKSGHIALIHLQYFKHQDAGIYIAYHGEPLVPPPNVAKS